MNDCYGYDSNQNYFDIIQGNKLIKVNIISKKNFEDTKQKILQNNGSQYAYDYKEKDLCNVLRSKNKTIITPDHCFVRKKGDTIYNIVENPYNFNFKDYEYYVPNITMIDKEDKCLCITQLKTINNINEYYQNKEENKTYLVNKDKKEIENFIKDFKQLQGLNDEVQEFLNGVPGSNYSTNKIPIGWINTFPGITLCSKKQSDGHYHCHNLGNFNGN